MAVPRSLIAFESLSFRWLAGSHLAFFLGMQALLLVRSLLAWDLTESELALAYVNLVVAVPMVVGSFVAGAVIDRMERRFLVMLAQVLTLINEGVVLALLLAGLLEFWHLLVSAFILGVTFPFVMPTRLAMVFGLVGRERLSNGMALLSASMNVARVLGPALAGLLIAVANVETAYAASLGLFVLSTFGMLGVPSNLPEPRAGKSLARDIGYSFTYVARHRDILLCLVFGLFPMLVVMPVFSLMVVFADEVWGTGESGLGMLMATLGLGGILGSLWVARLGDTVRRTRFMLLSSLLFAALLAGFSISPWFPLALVLLLVANVFSNIGQTLNHILIQLLAHEEVRGRMSSLLMISFGLTPLGVLPIAYFSEIHGIAITVFVACLLLMAAVLGFILFSPTLRGLDARMAEAARSEARQGLEGQEAAGEARAAI